jgi:hypothetical protein
MLVEIRVKGSCAGAESAFSVDGGANDFLVGAEVSSLVGAKVGSLVGAEGFPGGLFVGAEVSSLVRAAFVGAGSGGSSLAPDGTVGISFEIPLMFTARTSINRTGGIPIGTPLRFILRNLL